MAMKIRHMRTSTSSSGVGHLHYIDYINSSGNGQTKQFISKRTKQRHLHKIRNFVVSIADGHTHMLKRKEDKGGGCVIATHGVANGGFSPMEKAKAEIWCERTYHGKWYGEAFRRGYRYLASKHVEQDTASQFYQEFKDFVAFGRGLKKGLKLRLNYYFRTVQFFITGLFVSKDI